MRRSSARLRRLVALPILVLTAIPTSAAWAKKTAGEKLYAKLQAIAAGREKKTQLFEDLAGAGSAFRWDKAKKETFEGHLRLLKLKDERLYLVRKTDGSVYIVAPPGGEFEKGGPGYKGLDELLQYKLQFEVRSQVYTIRGVEYRFAHLVKKPKRLLLDRLFFIAIVLLLFIVMVGMGLTLRVNDFKLVLKQPKGMIVGPICQFGLLPFLAFLIGRATGMHDAYPFIFVGLLLVSSSPGGVTSNLMTFLGKGDVALSVSLTALSTVLSLALTPIILAAYATNIPDVNVPTGKVISIIAILVIVPLIVGMLVRWKFESFAKRSEKAFSIIGVFTLLFLIGVGVAGNLDRFADTDRYGLRFYATIFTLTLSGMVFGALLAKVVRVTNYQVRAIALETGLQNASLAMTIALLLQDQMGDFHSAMFFTSGIFGLWMYAAGGILIALFPRLLPIEGREKGAASA